MVAYLRLSPSVLLENVNLLQMIADLLPNLSRRIISALNEIIDDLMVGKATYDHESVLAALNAFPLDGMLYAIQQVLLSDTRP